jgi:hypothetical protein
MDPYLEGPLWSTVHSQLAPEIARQLGPQLRPKYLALTTEYYLLDEPNAVAGETAIVIPDVSVVRGGSSAVVQSSAATIAAPLLLETVMPARVPLVSVEVREARTRRLVTAIELLSPANKRGSGRKQYLARRRRLLMSTAHLLEIDLLRRGKRVPMRRPLPERPYFVILTRADRRPVSEVWPIGLADPLPKVPVPLLPGDADVELDVQLALRTVYDLVGYDLTIDYQADPPPPLDAEQKKWLDQRLRATGVRG